LAKNECEVFIFVTVFPGTCHPMFINNNNNDNKNQVCGAFKKNPSQQILSREPRINAFNCWSWLAYWTSEVLTQLTISYILVDT